MRKQRGITLTGTIFVLGILGFVGVMAAKLMPAYIEYTSVKKIFKTLQESGQTKGTVRDIRHAYEKINAIEDVKSVRGETVISAAWSVRVPMVYNISACLDFQASTGGGE